MKFTFGSVRRSLASPGHRHIVSPRSLTPDRASGRRAGRTAETSQPLAIDPANPATLYAGTNGSGVFKSTDCRGKLDGHQQGPDRHEVVSPGDRSSPPRPRYMPAQGDGVFKSTDGGGTLDGRQHRPDRYDVKPWRLIPRTRPRSTPARRRRSLQEHERRRNLDGRQCGVDQYRTSMRWPSILRRREPSTPARHERRLQEHQRRGDLDGHLRRRVHRVQRPGH